MNLDAHGRPRTKPCPDCALDLWRTVKVCPGCGHFFVGKHWVRNQQKAGKSDVPVKPAPKPVKVTKVKEVPSTPPSAPPESATLPPIVLDDFDCERLPDGRLRLHLATGDVILSRRHADIVAMELAL